MDKCTITCALFRETPLEPEEDLYVEFNSFAEEL